MAESMDIVGFKGGPSWCYRFMKRKDLSIRSRTTLCQQLPADFEEKRMNFTNYTQGLISEHSIGPNQLINMDEVLLTFDLPLSRTVNQKGESSVRVKTTGNEKTSFTCVLACMGAGNKLPPMVIF